MPTTEYRLCPHGFHHPPWSHSCDGCWCEGERDQREYGWKHDTTPSPNECEPNCRHRCPACRAGLVTHLRCDPQCELNKD